MIISTHRDGALHGARNMERDFEMLHNVQQGVLDIGFRSYTWDPWCVSLGRNQPISSIDALKCESLGFDMVQRPTGGRAVLHADEVTYCIVMRIDDSRSAPFVYQQTHELIFNALQSVAEGLSLSTNSTNLRTHYAASGPLGQACFTSHARSEIMCNGRKVVGSAQRVTSGCVLQHGSILCGEGHEQLADVITATDMERARLRSELQHSSATLHGPGNSVISSSIVAECIHDGLVNELHRRFAR
ncbi:MAG: hypothetical protein H7X70_07170 [Candidatus Kapabacteria bacterium]|nr:hypothetical protein [Candidatus Kapabacteria bacterium]